MASSRDEKKTEQHFDPTFSEFQKVESKTPPPANLPPEARPISNLEFPNKPQEDAQEPLTAHIVNKARKIWEKIKKFTHFFKNTKKQSPIAELEATCCAIAQYLAGDEIIPSAHAYYDESYQFVGLASKAFPGYKSNHDDPLKEKDTIIELMDELINNEIESQHNQLMPAIDALLDHYKERSKSSQSGYFNLGVFQYATNILNFYINPAITAVKFKEDLLKFKNTKNKYTFEYVHSLLKLLKLREEHITKELQNNEFYKNELSLLKNIINTIEVTLDTAFIANRYFEEIDNEVKSKNINLNSLSEENNVFEKIAGFVNKTKDLKNYRTDKQLAVGLVTRFLLQDTDGHNQNMGYYIDEHNNVVRAFIDWDMAKLRFLFQFRNPTFWDRRLRQPGEQTFVITARDLAQFPDIQDADFYYWPTRETYLADSMADKISSVYKNIKNFFKKEDCEVFKKLASKPVFVFHKYKTLLKYILTDIDTYCNINLLHLRRDLTFKDEADRGKTKNLFKEILKDEAARIEKVKTELLKVPGFDRFLAHHGSYVLQMIKAEAQAYKEKYAKKIAKKPYFKNLVKSINIDAMEKKYNDLYKRSGADAILKQNVAVNFEIKCKV